MIGDVAAAQGPAGVPLASVRRPAVGDSYPSRTEIQAVYGGDKIPGITRFPGDSTVNVFSNERGRYSDDPPSLVAPFGYRGEGRVGTQRVDRRGNARLEKARVEQAPVRFWYRPNGGAITFLTWCVVIGRSWVNGVDDDGLARAEIEWVLSAVPSANPDEWPAHVSAALDDGARAAEAAPLGPEARPDSTYAELVARVEARGQGDRVRGVPRLDFARSAAARRAVLLRSRGKCESPWCTGMPAERNRQGDPILDVDHIRDLGLGGDDHPRNMVALCPNCHACKTRGERAPQWRKELVLIAAAADSAARGEG